MKDRALGEVNGAAPTPQIEVGAGRNIVSVEGVAEKLEDVAVHPVICASQGSGACGSTPKSPISSIATSLPRSPQP